MALVRHTSLSEAVGAEIAEEEGEGFGSGSSRREKHAGEGIGACGRSEVLQGDGMAGGRCGYGGQFWLWRKWLWLWLLAAISIPMHRDRMFHPRNTTHNLFLPPSLPVALLPSIHVA